MLRRIPFFLLLLGTALAAVPALAQEAPAAGPIAVADVRGPLDQRALDFLEDVVLNEDAQLIVLKVDNPGVASGDISPLLADISASATPVVAWVGPEGAVAFGDTVGILDAVQVAGGAPGARYGFSDPMFHGVIDRATQEDSQFSDLTDSQHVIEVTDDRPGFIVQPTIGQFIAALDGMQIETSAGPVTLETAREETRPGGVVVITSSVDVRFLKPTLLTRFLRLGTRPDAAFFFLLAGLAVAAFEFYAAGAGVAAAVAALALFLAGYGFATLPVHWWAVVTAVAGIGLDTWDFQRQELGIRTIVGTILMFWGGLAFVGGPQQISTSFWGVLLTVIGITLFYLFAMTTIVRSRFGTPTIGREHLVGAVGTVESVLDPDGVVIIEGAKWRARAHRATSVSAGAEIEVLSVEGITLQVAPHEVAKSQPDN